MDANCTVTIYININIILCEYHEKRDIYCQILCEVTVDTKA